MNSDRMKGNVALVTGGGSGIGRACALPWQKTAKRESAFKCSTGISETPD